MALLYGDEHPYGRRVKGTADARSTGARARMLVRLHAETFAPVPSTAVVVGDVDPARAVQVSRRVFGDWMASAPLPPDLPQPTRSANTRGNASSPMMNKSQADVAYGFIDDCEMRIPTTTRSG